MLQLALSRHLRHFTAFTVLILGCAQTQSQEISACFPSVAVPKSDRKFLTGPRGPYPIGVWVCDWPAAYVTSEVVHILLEEILGFHVVQTGPGPNTVDAFYALAGCANPLNIQDRGCSATPVATTNHINVEGWTESYARTWAQIERDYPQNAPRNLGNMGYFGKTSMFLPKSIQLAAYNKEGLILEFYRGFNVSWTEADKYFDPPSSINKDWLKPCVETRLMITKAMEEYVTITDDWEGVEIVTNENGKSVSRGKCWDDYFWYAPACRDKPSKCVIFFTGGSGWNLEETMQKATAWNMPLAPAVAKTWGNFTQLPLQIDSTFYWWVPDPTFLSLDAVEITFPPFDRTAFRRGDMRTAPTALSIDKYVSQDLQTLAPEAHQLVRDMVMDLETVNDMLRDQKKTGDSSRAVACRWLQGHEDVWKPWLPDPTKCFSGFGLYHPPSNSFVKDRRNPVSLACSPCPSGTFSSKLVDGAGITFVCEPCPAGSIQASGASVECIPCKAGEYQDENGSISCKRCGMGEYQDQTGATGCKPCPTATSTHGLGSLFLGDCGCKQGSINVANATVGVVTCVACPEGLRCPLGSSLESLKMGDKNFGEAFTPRILEGYFSTEEQPLEVFKCQTLEHCPGGVPGRCPGRREGIPCSECPSGTSWTGKECRQCSGGLVVVPILAGSVFFLGLIAAYYAIPPCITAKATQGETLSMCAGVAAGLVQCLAIIGLTSVRWPKAFESIAKSSSVVLLDMEIFSIACMVGGTNWGRYIMSLAVFPLGPLWLLVCFTSSRCFKNCMCPAPWTWTRLLNTMGHFLQDFTILNLRRRQSSVEIAELIKKVSERLLDLEAASAKEVLDQMHPGDVSRIIDTIQLLRTELLSQRSDDVRTTSNRSSTSRVSSCKRRSVLVPYNAPSPSDEDPKNTAKGEGVPRSAGVFACAMRLLRRPQRVQPAGLGGGAEMTWLNVPGVAGSHECESPSCDETLEKALKVEKEEKEEKAEKEEKDEKEENAEKVEKEKKEEIVDDPTRGESVTNAVLMDSQLDALTANNSPTLLE
ncbi:unnamed protein product [Cladocopium goreaui]|uniref:Tyrosine-protein kinase ephrin type A/B receptor-like domain-containing protein n=1 Tax=Cladocopium goreaui TaxID=2562237 RepID=A0A9P1CX74_9DINO|nr:unnamed protein product [Cladocopium goreaui]